MKACFTGHRQIEPEDMLRLPELLGDILKELIARGVDTFYAGGALGFDTLASLKVLEMKNRYPHLRLCLILPHRGQSDGWTDRNREIYEYILRRADAIRYVCEEYRPSCMHKRNRALVDESAICVAFCEKEQGGSAYTLSYARQKGKECINLYDRVRSKTSR